MDYNLELRRKIEELENANERLNDIDCQGEELRKEANQVNRLEFKIRKQIAAIGATISLGVCFGILAHSIAAKIDEQQYTEVSTRNIASYETVDFTFDTLQVGADRFELDYQENNSNPDSLSTFINEDGTINIKRILATIYTMDFCIVLFIVIGILENIKKTKKELVGYKSIKDLEERIYLIKQEYDNELRKREDLKEDLINFIIAYNKSITDDKLIDRATKLIRVCN